jgi:uncharacterized integral membrane protein
MKKAKLVLVLILSLFLVLIVAQNTATVQGHFLWLTAEMPVIVLLLLTAAIGFMLGLIVALFAGNTTKSGS